VDFDALLHESGANIVAGGVGVAACSDDICASVCKDGCEEGGLGLKVDNYSDAFPLEGTVGELLTNKPVQDWRVATRPRDGQMTIQSKRGIGNR